MSKSKISIFLYAITSAIHISLVGRLIFSEVIALVTFPFTKFSFLLKKYKAFKFISKSYFLLFVAQIISDIVNESIPGDYMRGISVIIFSYMSIVFLLKQINKKPQETIILYFIGMFFIRLIFGQQDLDIGLLAENSNFFKQRFVGFLNLGFMVFSFYSYKKKKKSIVPILFFFYAAFCLALDARSNGLIFLISAVILYIKNKSIKINKSTFFILITLSSFILYLGYVFYIDKVLNNEIGGSNSKNQIAIMSNPYNPFELLYVGRLGTFIAISAISEKPFIGHGSWAVDKGGKYAKLQELLSDKVTHSEKRFIPSHSIILGTWLYAGFLGFLATLLIFKKMFSIYFRILKNDKVNYLLPILTVLTIDMMWASVFSPFGLLRTSVPIYAAMLIYFEYNNSIFKTQ